MVPDGLRYSKEHEWMSLEGEIGTIGITDHAQNELGDLVFVDLPEIGSRMTAGEEFGTVESVKAVSELYAPVSGEVVEVNEALRDAPETINTDPYGGGWIVKVRLADPAQVPHLLDAPAYKAYLEGL